MFQSCGVFWGSVNVFVLLEWNTSVFKQYSHAAVARAEVIWPRSTEPNDTTGADTDAPPLSQFQTTLSL